MWGRPWWGNLPIRNLGAHLGGPFSRTAMPTSLFPGKGHIPATLVTIAWPGQDAWWPEALRVGHRLLHGLSFAKGVDDRQPKLF